MPKAAKRLYEQFQPKHYELEMHPDLEGLTFSGVVEISGQKVGRPSKRLTFHQKGLKISKVTITKTGKQEEIVKIARINHQAKLNEVRIHAQEMLYPGNYTVVIHFSGKISRSMLGLYVSEFNHDGKTKRLLATQFESHHARKAFPCIDEPEAKATFQLSLILPEQLVALSNTPISSEKPHQPGGKRNPGFKIMSFEVTPRMSTYLFAFVCGELHSVEATTKDGTIVRSWSTVAQDRRFLQYSVDEAVKLLEFFTDYFGVAYPLKKCDQVALPDFDAGAMENWGLITYREVALLADPDNRSISNEQYVSMVVAHELSHQWFGNLVTMRWWDDLWLNESFASFMEHLALDAIHPDWQQWEHYTASDVISTSSRDVYHDVQPVAVTVTDPDLIDTLFDPGIVYAKGGRLLKMLREHIGDDAFRKGLTDYFHKHAYSNASRSDLWEALSKTSGEDLVALMDPWLLHAGMPVLSVDQRDAKITLSQHRFLLDDHEDDHIWPIPLLADRPLDQTILSTATASVNAQNKQYVLFNQYGSGHYFVNYLDPKHRRYLTDKLQRQELPTEARINLLNDAYMLARKGETGLASALDIIKDCSDEARDSVWAAISRLVVAASQLTEGHKPSEKRLKTLRRTLASDWFERLGWDDDPSDDPNTKQLRHTALAYLAAGEDERIISEAKKRYERSDDLQSLPAEIRTVILSTVVRHGDTTIIDDLLTAYPNESPDIQADICSALSATKKPEIAAKIYDRALGPKGFVRPQDLMRWLAIFLRNHHIRDYVWDWLVENWGWLEQTLGESKSFDYLPIYCASVINTPAGEKRYHALFDSKLDIKTLKQNIMVGYADITARIAWRKRDETQLKDWLSKNFSAE